jgi:uncharacterized protein (TIGR03435 family)
MDRIVIDKTGISGKFDFHLEFAPDESTAGLVGLRVIGARVARASACSVGFSRRPSAPMLTTAPIRFTFIFTTSLPTKLSSRINSTENLAG